MIRSLSILRLTASSAALCAFALWPHLSAAQNYIDRNAFTGPNVVIDFATLDHMQHGGASAPVYQEALPFPAPSAAPSLTPPAAREARPMISPTPMPASPRTMAIPSTYNDNDSGSDLAALPPHDNFNARDMLNAAPVAAAPAAKPSTPAFNAESGNIRTRAMLAEARTTTKDQHGRVNLASISSTPPVPPRASAPLQATSDTSDSYKPVTKAPVAPRNNPSTVPMPPQEDLGALEQDELPPITTASVSKSSLPLPDDAPKSAPSKANASFTLAFGKESGELDQKSKSELDKIISALRDDSTLRAQVRAYASGSADNGGQARRLSLTRALAARTYVLDHDIPATRLDIRALGNSNSGKTEDKVDITLVK
jgi:outer membrane protein OmpA-like peptidoglycan-associated protein